MSVRKVQKLLAVLTATELKQIEQQIKAARRDSLKHLFAAIKKAGKSKLDKQATFQKVFGRSYAKELDYLFRNELRLLKDKIQDFLIVKEGEREIRHRPGFADLMLLRSLLQRGLSDEFEREFRKRYERTLASYDFIMAHRLSRLYFNFVMTHPEISPDTYQGALNMLRENRRNIKLVYRSSMAINQHSRAATELFLRIHGLEADPCDVGLDLDFQDVDNAYIRFFEYSALVHLAQGDEQLQQAQKVVENGALIQQHFPQHYVDGLSILGGVYFTARDYPEARRWYEKALAAAKQHKLTARADLVFNYCSVLMKMAEYETVIQLIEEHAVVIDALPRVRFRFECLHAFCFIFLGQPDKVLSILPGNIGQRPETEYQYFRFIYCILPYLHGDYETGKREAANFLRYFQRRGDKLTFPHEQEIAEIFRLLYHTLLQELDSAERRRQLAALLARVERYTKARPQYLDYLYIRWLEMVLRGER